MAVLAAPIAPSLTQAAGPSCSLQRSGSLWQLGIEAQELTTAIGQLAEQLQSDDDDSRSQALAAKADATCWVIEHLHRPRTCHRHRLPRQPLRGSSSASRWTSARPISPPSRKPRPMP